MSVELPSPKTIEQLRKRCAIHRIALRRSAMFALSRGAKELFHTNFLAFVLELEIEALAEEDRLTVELVQRALLTRLFGHPVPEQVVSWREPQRLDLVIAALPGFNSNGHPTLGGRAVLDGKPRSATKALHKGAQNACIVVIEAKLKALPDAAQLASYNDVLRDALVLTLDPELELGNKTEPAAWGALAIDRLDAKTGNMRLRAYPPERTDDSGRPSPRHCFASGVGLLKRLLLAPADNANAATSAGWCFLSWSDFLDDFDHPSSATGGAVTAMLRDYAVSTRALITVLQEVADFVKHGYAEGDNRLLLHAVAMVPDDFRSLRIHDVVGKYAYSVLQQELCKALDRQAVLSSVGSWRRIGESFMTRGTPGFYIEYRLEDGVGRSRRRISVGVQVQGTAYRHYVSASHPSKFSEGYPLKHLVDRLRDATGGKADWWSQASNGVSELKKFDAEGFRYSSVDAASLTFKQLTLNLISSLGLAAMHVQDAELTAAARLLMSSRA